MKRKKGAPTSTLGAPVTPTLVLTKRSVASLSEDQLSDAAGGHPHPETCERTCPATCQGDTCERTCDGPSCYDTCNFTCDDPTCALMCTTKDDCGTVP